MAVEGFCQLRLGRHVKKRAGEAGKSMYLECGEIYGFLTNVIAVEGRDEVVDGDAHGWGRGQRAWGRGEEGEDDGDGGGRRTRKSRSDDRLRLKS